MKRFIKQNQQEIETFPVKFLSKSCGGYAMYHAPEAAPIFAMAAKIAAIFRKHGRLDLEWDVDPDDDDPRRVDVV